MVDYLPINPRQIKVRCPHFYSLFIHVFLCFGLRAILGVAAGVYNTVHINVQAIALDIVGVGTRAVKGQPHLGACSAVRQVDAVFQNILHDFGILFR